MPVVFLCQNCRSRLKVGRKKIGTQVECPRCREPLTVPTAEGAAAASASVEVGTPKAAGDLFPEFAVFDGPPPPPTLAAPSAPPPPASPPPPSSQKRKHGSGHAAGTNGTGSAEAPASPAPPKPPDRRKDRQQPDHASEPEASERHASAKSPAAPARERLPPADKPIGRSRSAAARHALGVVKREDQPSSYCDVLSIRRRTLYFQAALIVLMAAVGLGLGFLIGRGVGPPDGGTAGGNGDVHVAGTLTFRNARGEEAPDSGAVVIALPAEIPANKIGTLLVTGLGPQTLREAGRVAEMAIEELGGKYDRTDALGNFVLKLPRPGTYRLLFISRGVQRPDGEVVTAAQLREMQRYFNAPAELIGNNKYAWALRDVRDPRLAVLHTF